LFTPVAQLRGCPDGANAPPPRLAKCREAVVRSGTLDRKLGWPQLRPPRAPDVLPCRLGLPSVGRLLILSARTSPAAPASVTAVAVSRDRRRCSDRAPALCRRRGKRPAWRADRNAERAQRRLHGAVRLRRRRRARMAAPERQPCSRRLAVNVVTRRAHPGGAALRLPAAASRAPGSPPQIPCCNSLLGC
jgi:hypothetical protein